MIGSNSEIVTISTNLFDTVSSLNFSPDPNTYFLEATTWEQKSYIFDCKKNSNDKKVLEQNYSAPILHSSFFFNDKVVLSGPDNKITMWDLSTNSTTTIGQTNNIVLRTFFVPELNNTIFSLSYDNYVTCWDVKSPNPICFYKLPDSCKPITMSICFPLCAIATNSKHVAILDLQATLNSGKLDNPYVLETQMDTPTKSMLCLKSLVILGTLEGRCQMLTTDLQKLKSLGNSSRTETFTFRANRTESKGFAVNTISGNTKYDDTFATGGSDGIINFWNHKSKTKISNFIDSRTVTNKNYKRDELEIHPSITESAFHPRGDYFAFAIGYDWSKGYKFFESVAPEIYCKNLNENDFKYIPSTPLYGNSSFSSNYR